MAMDGTPLTKINAAAKYPEAPMRRDKWKTSKTVATAVRSSTVLAVPTLTPNSLKHKASQ
jgi:hypothetical protein